MSRPLYTCMESPLMTSPLKWLAMSMLSRVFPTAVGPTIDMIFCFISIPLYIFIHTRDKHAASRCIFPVCFAGLQANRLSVHHVSHRQEESLPLLFQLSSVDNPQPIVLLFHLLYHQPLLPRALFLSYISSSLPVACRQSSTLFPQFHPGLQPWCYTCLRIRYVIERNVFPG